MSRRIRFLLALLAVSFALTAAACADATGPSRGACPPDWQSGNTNTCLAADWQSGNTIICLAADVQSGNT